MDVVGSFVGLLFAAPILAMAAVWIKASSRGPILYPHIRVGERGRQFVCYKLRTMVVDADQSLHAIAAQNSHSDSRTFKIPNDPRITRVGRWLRRLSIDELPQLWNVFVGDMSLVGPRPPVPREVAQYRAGDRRRLLVKPGLTCIWQVSGRSRLSFPEQLEMDLAYIRGRSVWLDFKLLLQTIPAVLSTNGAY
jgi:lipopolysaccharide/colanic/teichoic acid biosynthesis glycosyltransferase